MLASRQLASHDFPAALAARGVKPGHRDGERGTGGICRDSSSSAGSSVWQWRGDGVHAQGPDIASGGGEGGFQAAGGVGGSTGTFYPCYDGNGNITEYLTSSGALQLRDSYDPFGETNVATGSIAHLPYRFSTKPADPSTGYYYYGYRWYNALTGRWNSRDPIGEEGGVNLYGFVGNDGVNGWDYLGLDFIAVAKTEVGASLSNSMAPGRGGRFGHLLLVYWELECALDESDFRWRSDAKEWFAWHGEQGHKPDLRKVIQLVPTKRIDGSEWRWNGRWRRARASSTFSFSVILSHEGDVGQMVVDRATKIRPVLDGWPDTGEVEAKWRALEDYANTYRYAEQEGFGDPRNFPRSVYGHPLGGGFHSDTWTPFHATVGSVNSWPFNNSNTFVISALDAVGLGSGFVGGDEFPGNRSPSEPPGGVGSYEKGDLSKVSR